MRDLVLAIAGATILATSAYAAPAQSPWKEGRFVELADWSFDESGVRVSNCHMAFFGGATLQAVPRCYVMNRAGRPSQARVQFVALDEGGDEVISATLTASGIADMTGQEMLQLIPITTADRSKIHRAKLRAWVSN